MVKALIKNNHTAMLEHASLAVKVDSVTYDWFNSYTRYFEQTEGIRIYLRYSFIGKFIISGNIRAWREFLIACGNSNLDITKPLYKILNSEKYRVLFKDIECSVTDGGYAVEVDPCGLTPEEQLIHRDFTVLFTVDRGVSHEIVRHRVASFAQESTRYCNYGKSGEISCIKPCYLEQDTPAFDNWVDDMMRAESAYLRMLESSFTPQEARGVLPTHLKTEVVMTSNLNEWRHFFNLRAVGVTGKPHPQMLEVAVPLLEHCKTMIPVVFDDLEVIEC